jgi:hypothetical protein
MKLSRLADGRCPTSENLQMNTSFEHAEKSAILKKKFAISQVHLHFRVNHAISAGLCCLNPFPCGRADAIKTLLHGAHGPACQ